MFFINFINGLHFTGFLFVDTYLWILDLNFPLQCLLYNYLSGNCDSITYFTVTFLLLLQNISNIVMCGSFCCWVAMEVLLPKLPSFKFPSATYCCSITSRSSSYVRFGFRRVSVCASTVNEAVAKPIVGFLSLGHSTRPHFPILHQVSIFSSYLQYYFPRCSLRMFGSVLGNQGSNFHFDYCVTNLMLLDGWTKHRPS